MSQAPASTAGPVPPDPLTGGDALLDALPSRIAVVDRQLVIRAVNRAWVGPGVGTDYLAAWRAETVPTPELAERLAAGLTAVLDGQAAEHVEEYPQADPTGTRWTLLRAAPVGNGAERLAMIAHVDITSRKAAERFSAVQHEVLSMVVAERPLPATLERLAAAVAAEAPGATCTISRIEGPTSRFRLAAAAGGPGDRAERLIRMDGLEQLGIPSASGLQPVTELQPPEVAGALRDLGLGHVAQAPIRARRGEDLGSVALWFAAPDRPEARALELLALAVPLAAIAIERHQTAETIRDRETRSQSVFALHPDAVLILDPDGVVQSMNPAAEQLLAESAGGFAGQPFVRLVPPNLVEPFADRLRRALTGYPQRFRTSIHPKGRALLEADVTFVPLVGGGDVSGVYVVAKNITEQLAAAERLEQSGRQLRQSAKMEAVGRLAGGVAHDFNNLLTAIRGYTDLLLTQADMPEGARQDLGEIVRAVDRATALTRQLLAFSRQQVVQRRVVELGAVVEECRSMLARLVHADTQLSVHTPADPIWVLADPTQLHQLVINLVVNAQDAMPNGGRLVIETGRIETARNEATTPLAHLDPGTYATLSVTDTGRGMDRETQAHIFEPFFTTKPPGQGTGLGLYTVYGIVEQSGGRIGFESAVDRGTRFVVYLPLQRADAAAPERIPPPTRVRGGHETILLVEDDESVRRMVRKILAAAGYEVLEARHGADALLVSREYARPIDLLLTDVVMPELNGLRLAHLLASERPDTAVVYMSGYARDEVDRRGLMAPGVVFIHKPFTAAELAEAVRSTLDRRPARDAPGS